MPICPSCQLPNAETAESCMWCGRHSFVGGDAPLPAEPPPAAVVPGGGTVHTTRSLASSHKPLPSHVNILLTPAPREPQTVVETPPPAASSPGASTATPVPTDTAPPTIRAKLIVLRGQKINQDYPLYEGRNLIGRFADHPVDVDLTVQEAEGQVWSSRKHALITFDRNVLLVEDLNSLNGTWVNGSRLSAGSRRPLRENDVIQIGAVQLKLVIY